MNAAKITRTSKSNLALAFVSLGRERRRDITTFYAFCRVIDDVADNVDLRTEEKRRRLDGWRESLRKARPNESSFAPDVRHLMEKYALTPEMLEEIIAGVEMDLSIKRYQSLALQMTNIIRDVGKDLRADRIYLPQEDLARFNYSEKELQNRQYNDRFVQLMQFEAARARQFFGRAAEILPREDQRSMVAAEIMASIYRGLLRRMELDKFRVLEKEYGLNKLEKAARIATQLLKLV